MPWRTGNDELDRAAAAAVERALEATGIKVRNNHGELVIRTAGGDQLALRIKGVSRFDDAKARTLIDQNDIPEQLVVVADELTRDAQDVLRAARVGFLDRRGHLYLRDDTLHLDVDVPADPRLAETRPAEPIRGRAGITIAAALLLDPDEPLGVRELARRTELPVSTTSKALTPIREAALIDDRHALVPDLFWALADAWRPARVPLAERPPAHTGILAGTVAAAELGAPVAAAADSPPDLYVQAAHDLRTLERRYGTTSGPSRAASVGVEPTPLISRTARDNIAHPLFVALDLAQDRARGREILDGWNPTGTRRVW